MTGERRTARFEATHHRIVPPSAGLWHVRSYAPRQCLSIELGQSDTRDRKVCFASECDAELVCGSEGRTGSREPANEPVLLTVGAPSGQRRGLDRVSAP